MRRFVRAVTLVVGLSLLASCSSSSSGGGGATGTLAFGQATYPVAVGGTVTLSLGLGGYTGSTSVSVAIASSSATVASVVTTSCTMSSQATTCPVQVSGVAAGSATITASGTGLTSGSTTVVVTQPGTPVLNWSPSPLVLATTNTNNVQVNLNLVNAPATAVTVALAPASDSAAVLRNSPGDCQLSAASPSCTVNVNHASVSDATGLYHFVATPAAGSGIAPLTLPVYVASLTPAARVLTVVNECATTVWAGISGGSVYDGNIANCPPGSTSNGSYCYWDNPRPPGDVYTMAPGATITFTIPATSLTNVAGRTDQWSGGVMARLGCDSSGNCTVGTCNGGASGSLGCARGHSFATPQTVAEFTLLMGGSDTYDVQVINGVTVPTSMKPTNATVDAANPYNNGEAGAVQAQAGTQYALNGASWTFTAPQVGSPASRTYFDYVTGTAGATDSCSDAQPCPAGQVCGYARNSFDNTLGTPTYARTCGTRIGYLTADAVWKGNPDVAGTSNTAPFDFYAVRDNVAQSASTPYPNSNAYPMHRFVDCPNPPMNSGYQAATTYPTACGCTDWVGIATPTANCQGGAITSYGPTTQGIGFNSAWTNHVLPLISWLKTGCPTCYAYQFDDASSTFNGYVAQSTSNAANGTSYTITFCPGGKAVPAN